MLIKIHCPEYDPTDVTNLAHVGKRIDAALVEKFNNKKIVLRALSSAQHSIPKQQLLSTIEKLGYDRYDPKIVGDRYKNVQSKHIDFFGRQCIVKQHKKISQYLLDGFHIYGAKFHGRQSPKMDIWLVYDRTKLTVVHHQYEGSNKTKRDGYIFVYPNKKPDALLGILSID